MEPELVGKKPAVSRESEPSIGRQVVLDRLANSCGPHDSVNVDPEAPQHVVHVAVCLEEARPVADAHLHVAVRDPKRNRVP